MTTAVESTPPPRGTVGDYYRSAVEFLPGGLSTFYEFESCGRCLSELKGVTWPRSSPSTGRMSDGLAGGQRCVKLWNFIAWFVCEREGRIIVVG